MSYLYDAHDYCRNFWSKGNANLPLVRYLGCKFTLYQSEDVDYIFTYHNNYPMVANVEMYNATQPSMLMMTKHSIKVPSKRTQKRRKPYKIVKIRPPAQLQNKSILICITVNKPTKQYKTRRLNIFRKL